MADGKLYTRAKASELVTELRNADRKPKSTIYKKTILKKIIANMTISNNEVISLAPEIIKILNTSNGSGGSSSISISGSSTFGSNSSANLGSDPEVKRLCYLFFTAYYQSRPEETNQLLPFLKRDFYRRAGIANGSGSSSSSNMGHTNGGYGGLSGSRSPTGNGPSSFNGSNTAERVLALQA
ncbi:unnamed protein product [Ambrosiozyma monospora]|uniref:Unnamed protein product n=1 Tax=Ambrosiozyma monospora TaxID=43982 RepID=A0A9W6T4C7_AMBMO|nr:unnamed protein product [Ambrosiozyma monospora]